MAAKTTTVCLFCEAIGAKEFEISHAERLLSMRNNGGWVLSDKEFEFKNGVISKRNSGKDKGTAQKSND